MIGTDTLDRVIGADVIDADGNKIGTASEVFLDDQSGAPEWVTVKTGMFGTKESFVPIRDADLTGDGLRVPVTKSAVKDSVDRWRPRSSADGKEHRPQAGGQRDKELSSFPSGHSAGALAVAGAFAAEYPQHRALAGGAAQGGHPLGSLAHTRIAVRGRTPQGRRFHHSPHGRGIRELLHQSDHGDPPPRVLLAR